MDRMLRPPLETVFRRREHDEPVDDRRLRRARDSGEVVRIGPGSYTHTEAWASLRPGARHAQRVWESAARLGPGQVFSHYAAAALHGIECLGRLPDLVDVSVDRSVGTRTRGRIRRHSRAIDDVSLQRWGSHFVTTAAQTAIDLAAVAPFTQGVAILDQALWRRRPGGPLATRAEIDRAAAAVTGRGSARVRRAVEFATDASDSVRESQSRVVLHLLGFPAPVLQARFILDSGHVAFTDFFWPAHRHIGEFDGVDKYIDPEQRRGLTPEQVLVAEKDREDSLRRQVAAFSRWRTPMLTRPRLLYDLLTAAGLPSTAPRPGR